MSELIESLNRIYNRMAACTSHRIRDLKSGISVEYIKDLKVKN